MKKTIFLSFVITAFSVFTLNSVYAHVNYIVDTKASSISWNGKKVTGEHSGNINISNGTVLVHGNSPLSSKLTIDMKSISCSDIKDDTYNAKLVGHLKSDDFFGVENNPTASFDATAFTRIEGDGSDGINYSITGKLTLKGITNEISFPASVSVSGSQINAEGTASIDRTKWEVKYGSGSFFENLGDKMIDDNFTITFKLVANSGG